MNSLISYLTAPSCYPPSHLRFLICAYWRQKPGKEAHAEWNIHLLLRLLPNRVLPFPRRWHNVQMHLFNHDSSHFKYHVKTGDIKINWFYGLVTHITVWPKKANCRSAYWVADLYYTLWGFPESRSGGLWDIIGAPWPRKRRDGKQWTGLEGS